MEKYMQNDETEYLKRRIAELEKKAAVCDKLTAQLNEANELSTLLLQTAPFAIDVVDTKGNILFLNIYMENIVGKDAIGEKCWDAYKDDKKQCAYCPLTKEIKIGETAVIETSGALGGRIFKIYHTGMMSQGKKAILE